jgi:hypothetical protein
MQKPAGLLLNLAQPALNWFPFCVTDPVRLIKRILDKHVLCFPITPAENAISVLLTPSKMVVARPWASQTVFNRLSARHILQLITFGVKR